MKNLSKFLGGKNLSKLLGGKNLLNQKLPVKMSVEKFRGRNIERLYIEMSVEKNVEIRYTEKKEESYLISQRLVLAYLEMLLQ